MATGVSKNGLPWIHDGSIDDSETSVRVSDPKESEIQSGSYLLNWWPNLLDRQSLYFPHALAVWIKTEFLKEGELEGDFANKLKRSHMVD